MLLALPEPTTGLPPPPPAVEDEAPSLRRRIPAVAAAEPRGAAVPGRVVEEDVDWEEEPRAIIGYAEKVLKSVIIMMKNLRKMRERVKV